MTDLVKDKLGCDYTVSMRVLIELRRAVPDLLKGETIPIQATDQHNAVSRVIKTIMQRGTEATEYLYQEIMMWLFEGQKYRVIIRPIRIRPSSQSGRTKHVRRETRQVPCLCIKT
jgi:hypothetical protein